MEQKTHGHVEAKLHGFLTSALVGSEWRVSDVGEIVSDRNALGWVEPRASVDGVEERQNPLYEVGIKARVFRPGAWWLC
jgi:hypothetical protein